MPNCTFPYLYLYYILFRHFNYLFLYEILFERFFFWGGDTILHFPTCFQSSLLFWIECSFCSLYRLNKLVSDCFLITPPFIFYCTPTYQHKKTMKMKYKCQPKTRSCIRYQNNTSDRWHKSDYRKKTICFSGRRDETLIWLLFFNFMHKIANGTTNNVKSTKF